MQHFRLLTEEHVRSVLPMSDLIATMESAVARFSAGDVEQPVRTVLQVGPSRALFAVMPVALAQPPAMGAKLVTVFNGNVARGLPSHLATIVLLDPDTGSLVAVLDGRYITEARTAAVSAVSARHLARVGASRLALIGSGVQARSHLEALQEVRRLADVRVWSPEARSRERFVREMAGVAHAPLRACETAAHALAGADLIVVATSSPTPVVRAEWIAPGAHVMCIGACRPDQREIDPALTTRARLYVDSRAAALVESGDVVMNIAEHRFGPDHLVGEIGEVVLGRVPARTSDTDITLFKSLGMAVEDVAAGDLVLRRAIEQGVGSEQVL